MNNPIRIGTRGSELALWQARFIQHELEKNGQSSSIHIISTKGDREQDLSFDKIEGKGFFVKEIEAALTNGEIDLAVHSHKDLETTSPSGLLIAAVSKRADPSDIMLIRPQAFEEMERLCLKPNAITGTSSSRRKSQLLHFRPDLQLRDIRGNVPTRVQKLREGLFDAIVLAKAGLDRLALDLSGLKQFVLDPEEFVPAPAQGVLALQCRESDEYVRKALIPLHDSDVAELIRIERTVLRNMEGGCHVPLGVFAFKREQEFEVHVSIAALWDSPLRRFTFVGDDANGLIDLITRQIKKQ